MAYYTNLTKNDLLMSDIGITIRAGQSANPRQINPSISEEQLHESESIGALYKALLHKKLVKSNGPPKSDDHKHFQKLKESSKPIPSRTRIGIAIDPKKKQYIEELVGATKESLLKFEEYADGFAEPDIETEVVDDAASEQRTDDSQPQSRYVDIKLRY